MRVLMKAQMPTEAGNAAINNGSLPKVIGQVLESVKAEAAYFTAEDGMRTAMIFFEMEDSSEIPSAAEPLFMGLGARISFMPVMNVDDLQKGLSELAR